MVSDNTFSRRWFLGAAGATAGAVGMGGLLSGCGGSNGSSSGGKATLEVWMYSEPSRTAIQNQMVADFKKANPNIDIHLTRTDFTTYYSKLATSIASGSLPDVFMMSGAYFYQAAHQGALMDLTDRVKSANISLDDYFGTPTGEDVSWEGKTYGIPGEIDTVALAYNEDMFEEAGLDLPTPGWTWDQLLHAAREMTGKKKGKQRYGFYSRNSSQEVWGDFVRQNGGNFLNESYTKGGLDSPEAIEAIQFAVDLIHKYKVSPSPLGVSSLPGYIESTGNPFLTGLLGMKFQGNYEMALLSQIKGFKWNVVQMPKQKQPGGIGWYQSWVMGSNTKHSDEAWKFLQFLVTKGQTVTAKTPGRGLTPSLKSAADSSAFTRSGAPNMKAWTDGWADHFDFAFHPAWLEYQGIYSKALDVAFNNNKSVKDAIAKATPQVNTALARYPWFDASKLSPVAWNN
jgi:multiple sugar transport system substrate-binding protein